MASLPSATVPIRVTQLWAAGEILGRPREIGAVTVVLIVDLPVEQVPWWCDPVRARWWADTTRMSKLPVLAWWRVGAGPGVEPPDCSAATGLG